MLHWLAPRDLLLSDSTQKKNERKKIAVNCFHEQFSYPISSSQIQLHVNVQLQLYKAYMHQLWLSL